ncbi:hypothetical protein IQ268_01570 [Oculatella sp. LEGE 06141]|uniref:hypothetical protein n=1 Tax=Oculatella sp. LEGE 06141 TaxID=1828648 RepID=UPI00187E542E|nr:hypothetical protein [Oculatella sp. LEGE 06141]MBE9177262.1 hypothetical protein [Oculatella sp. LEGE 06141]
MQKTLLTLLTTSGLLLTPVILPEAALAQRVVDINPGVDSQNVSSDTPISGQFDPGTGPAVDAASVRVYVNGQDVTSRSTVTRNFFTYRPDRPFPPGAVQVRVDYRNVNGQQRSVAWSFTVQEPRNAIQIDSVTHNATSNALAPGATFAVTVNGTPGAQATVLLIQDGRTVRELPAQEVGTGVYTATLRLQNSDRVNEGIVVARLRRQTQTTYAAASQPVVFSASGSGSTEAPQTGGTTGGTTSGTTGGTTSPTNGNDLRPQFTSHREGASVSGRGFTLTGRTRPNATVTVDVTSGVSVLGLNVAGETLVNNRTVTANNNGEFELAVPAPRIPVPGTRYTVRATARSGNETSAETRITLTQD